MNFDIQIQTAPDIQVESTLTQDIDVEANLRLRGTFSNPAVLGRINITQGQVVFFGTKYNISQGSIAFYNPVRVEPMLDIDLETKARGIDVTLTVSGPLSKLNLTPRSRSAAAVQRNRGAAGHRAGPYHRSHACWRSRPPRRSPGSRWALRRCWARPSPAR